MAPAKARAKQPPKPAEKPGRSAAVQSEPGKVPGKKVYSWLKLLESRHARPPEKEPVMTGERGRPRLNVVTSQTSMTLSKGDREAIEFWQERLSAVLNRKVSMGETVGFLARVCQERMVLVEDAGSPLATLEDLVQVLVSGGTEEEG